MKNYFLISITDCFKMPSLPQSAFAVHKIREKHEHFTMFKKPTGFNSDEKKVPPKKQYGIGGAKSKSYTNSLVGRTKQKSNSFCSITAIVALAPVKYNEKMMNSIWGLYNRNSPHNFKKNNASGADGAAGQQQFVAAGAAVTAANVATAIKKIPDTENGTAALILDISPSSLLGQPIHHEDYYHADNHNRNHTKNFETGPYAGHTHAHGHHGNYHRHLDHPHFEEVLLYSMI